MSGTYVITAEAENTLRALQKLASLMSRKRLKIQDMQITETGFTLTLQADADCARWLFKQMKKCVDVLDLELKLATARVIPLPEKSERQHTVWSAAFAHE
jgi:hypothetical protein